MIKGEGINTDLDRFRFRGKYLDCVALIENHTSPAIARLISDGVIKRAPYLFGQKFELLRKHLDIWQNSTHVGDKLDKLAPFVQLRGELGHAIITEATIDDQPAFAWNPPGDPSWQSRKIVTIKEAEAMLTELQKLAEKLKKQSLIQSGPPNQASSPPPPSPDATAVP